MDAAAVSRLISAIPERVARAPSGMRFALSNADASKQAAQLALLARFLHWLSPLEPLGKEEQRALGAARAAAGARRSHDDEPEDPVAVEHVEDDDAGVENPTEEVHERR